MRSEARDSASVGTQSVAGESVRDDLTDRELVVPESAGDNPTTHEPAPQMIRVLLVDDQTLIRTGFGMVLSAEPNIVVVGEAGDGREALAWLERHAEHGRKPCDVVLMDVRMPGMNGIDATREIASRFLDVRVLVLTTFDLDEYALAAIKAGAGGFLLKDARPTELVDAIQRVHAGDAVMAPSATRRMVERIVADGAGDAVDGSGTRDASGTTGTTSSKGGSGTTRADGGNGTAGADRRTSEIVGPRSQFSDLTDREFQVLELITEGLNNSEIGERLYLTESTVKTHVGRIFSKLHLRDRVHAVILAKQRGL